jgi:hypothetical protein
MDDIQQQIETLQASVRHQRFAIIALAGVIIVGFITVFFGVFTRPKISYFDTIICKHWEVAGPDWQPRIKAGPFSDGPGELLWLNKDGTIRLAAGTDGTGTAEVLWLDNNQKVQIRAATYADGTVALPTQDLSSPKKP